MKSNQPPRFILMILFACICWSQGNAQKANEKRVGGECEGCEAIYESRTGFEALPAELTLPEYGKSKPGLIISGIVYKADGKTPAPGIVLYLYHTNQKGVYPTKGNEKGLEKRHGYLRGWVKTDQHGKYTYKTLRPASYPGSTEPAHIHCIVKEPGINEYYVADFVFADDPFVQQRKLESRTNEPGGNGVVKATMANGDWHARRNIFLGKDIENYLKY